MTDTKPCIECTKHYEEIVMQRELITQQATRNGQLLLKLDKIRALCLARNNPGVNVGAHELAGWILKIVEDE